jgi:hypothetical protein
MAIKAIYQWRSKMAGQELANKAMLMGIKNAAEIAQKAEKAADARNAEQMQYAITEANSATNANLLNWNNEDLVNLLLECPLDIEKIAHDAAANAVSRATKRIEAGLWASIDEEIILFAKSGKLRAVA